MSRALVRAAVDHARPSGAHALEVFLGAGAHEVGRPTLRRAVVRIDF